MSSTPRPWPRLADAWWVYAIAGIELVVFPFGLVTRIRCSRGRCGDSWPQHVLDLDSIGGLPRLLITGLFVGAGVLGWVAARRSVGSVRNWWRAVAATGAALALAKLVSVHSAAKAASPVLTLIVGVLLAAALLGVLAVTGRRWGVDAARPVVVALAGYAGAALGLDAVTWAVVSLDHHSATSAGATFVEELGEALTSLLVVVALRWHLPVGQTGAASDAGGYGGQAVRQQ